MSNKLVYKKELFEEWNSSYVNTFRIIFNQIFNVKLELLQDNKYYTNFNEPYKFQMIKLFVIISLNLII